MSRIARATIPTDNSALTCAKLPGLCPTQRVGFVAPATAQDRRVSLLASLFDFSDIAQELDISELTEIGAFEAHTIESGDLLGAI